ncbi:MAG: ribosome silencing factor [Chloracidobacterium sp.]|uniref:Ribosomal silencing factor RsfS n=1 Tax=Chloracidobacterium validum TaxID=2821543 RepID=A0ABX8B8U9_9BACT|nr:ribosome silencing factor [Chloracidobacterium validum]QUW02481.1 ribosome silencing factor [Chloracidobacterium validum]
MTNDTSPTSLAHNVASQTERTPPNVEDRRVWKTLHALQEKKGVAPIVLDISELTSFADYFVIATGTSSRHVQALADEVEKQLATLKVYPRHIEGYADGEWVLMDYGDVIVHVFTPEQREFYGLERLWSDAGKLVIREDAPLPVM